LSRQVVFLMVATFVSEPTRRGLVLLALSWLFTCLHLYARPFARRADNVVEGTAMASLTILSSWYLVADTCQSQGLEFHLCAAGVHGPLSVLAEVVFLVPFVVGVLFSLPRYFRRLTPWVQYLRAKWPFSIPTRAANKRSVPLQVPTDTAT